MRALTASEFCALYNISRSALDRFVDQGVVVRLGAPGSRIQRYVDPAAEYMQRVRDPERFLDTAPLLSVRDLAKHFGVGRTTVQKWVKRGKIRSTFSNNAHRFSVEDVRNMRLRHPNIRHNLGARFLEARLGPAPARELSFKEQGEWKRAGRLPDSRF